MLTLLLKKINNILSVVVMIYIALFLLIDSAKNMYESSKFEMQTKLKAMQTHGNKRISILASCIKFTTMRCHSSHRHL